MSFRGAFWGAVNARGGGAFTNATRGCEPLLSKAPSAVDVLRLVRSQSDTSKNRFASAIG